MHAVTSQLAQGAASGAPGICSWPHAWAGSGRTAAPARRQQHGLLRRCRHRAHGIGLGLERDRPPGHFRQSRRDGRVVCTHARRTGRQAGLSHRRQRGRTAFAPCPACRPQHAVQRAPPVIGQRARRGRRRLGPGSRAGASETFMRLVSVYRAMAAALCCGLGRATHILSAPAIPATARAPFPRRGRRGRPAARQDRRVAADQRYRHARHRQRPGARATFPQASSTRLHRLAVDSSLAAVSLAWRGGIRETHTGFASLRRYRRDALAVAALMAVLDGVDVPTPA